MVEVLVWNFLSNGNIGHAAIKVGGDYISWWPSEPASVKHGRSAGMPQSEADDLANEGRAPDHRIRLSGLDEEAIRLWWHGFRDGEEYRLFVQNCSTVVARALRAGGGTARTSGFGYLYHTWNVFWTPDDVRRLAEAIQSR